MKLFQRNPSQVLFIILIFSVLACSLSNRNIATQPGPLSTSLPLETPTQSFIVPVGLPAERADHAGDFDSSKYSDKNFIFGGEKFVRGLYERPFNADTMDIYFPDIDIIDTEGFKNDIWGVATITLAGLDADGKLSGNYAVELDLDKDGRGEWLIFVSNPSSTSWTTQGVKIFKDSNGDIGSKTPMFADEPASEDGYDTLVFDEGQGEPSDAAIVRVAPSDPKKINIAFKLSFIGNPKSFAMGVWAGNDSLAPNLFDFNDNFTHEQAGSPLSSLTVFPLKALAEIDNTCRMAINFFPSGNEPGLCANEGSQNAGGDYEVPGDVCTLTAESCGPPLTNPGEWKIVNCSCHYICSFINPAGMCFTP